MGIRTAVLLLIACASGATAAHMRGVPNDVPLGSGFQQTGLFADEQALPAERKLWGGTTGPVTYHGNGGNDVMINPLRVIILYVGFSQNDNVPFWMNKLTSNIQDTNLWRAVQMAYYRENPATGDRTYVDGRVQLVRSWYYPANYQQTHNVTNLINTDGWSSSNEVGTVLNYVARAIHLNLWTPTVDDLYLLVTANNVIRRPTDCNQLVGWHSFSTYTSNGNSFPVKFGFVPYDNCSAWAWRNGNTWTNTNGAPKGYNVANSPTGDPLLDSMVSILTHELVETVTNPITTPNSGWFGNNGAEEVMDLCDSWYRYPLLNFTAQNGQTFQYSDIVGGSGLILPLIFDPTTDVTPGTRNTQIGCIFGYDSNASPIRATSANVAYSCTNCPGYQKYIGNLPS